VGLGEGGDEVGGEVERFGEGGSVGGVGLVGAFEVDAFEAVFEVDGWDCGAGFVEYFCEVVPEFDDVVGGRGGLVGGSGDYGEAASAVGLELVFEDGDGEEEADDGEEDGDGAGGTAGHRRGVVSVMTSSFVLEEFASLKSCLPLLLRFRQSIGGSHSAFWRHWTPCASQCGITKIIFALVFLYILHINESCIGKYIDQMATKPQICDE